MRKGNSAAEQNSEQETTSSGFSPPGKRDSLNTYYQEMSRIPVLSVDEELMSGEKLVKARAVLREIKKRKKSGKANGTNAKADPELIRAKSELKEIEDEFMTHNLRLVIKVAHRYRKSGADLKDLIQDGNIGLRRAVKKFDPTMGYRFATYATWWIRHQIQRGLSDTGRLIRWPVHVFDTRYKYVRAMELASRDGSSAMNGGPGPEDIAELMGVPVEKVQKMATLPYVSMSLNAPVKNENGSHVIDMVPDEDVEPADYGAILRSDREFIRKLLCTLNPVEEFVIKHRFGLVGSLDGLPDRESGEKTLEEIGQIRHVTRERIRQIEATALKKLQRAARVYEAGLR